MAKQRLPVFKTIPDKPEDLILSPMISQLSTENHAADGGYHLCSHAQPANRCPHRVPRLPGHLVFLSSLETQDFGVHVVNGNNAEAVISATDGMYGEATDIGFSI
jgi:hypothetical protein